MSLVLRVDVDKPFGHSSLFRKIISKVTEDYLGFAPTHFPSYLAHQVAFLNYCNAQNVPGFFYYRTCTRPSEKVARLMAQGGHKTGFHAENTRTFETCSNELNKFREKNAPVTIESFTKHGSGVLKLGKHHYPKYEPENYLEWSKVLNCRFDFGNEICESGKDLIAENGFHKAMFWIEPDYRSSNFNTIGQLLEVAKNERVVVLIHPENYYTFETVANEFKSLVEASKKENIPWEVY